MSRRKASDMVFWWLTSGRRELPELAQGLVPQIVVTTPLATVGGTLSSDSIGQASRRFPGGRFCG